MHLDLNYFETEYDQVNLLCLFKYNVDDHSVLWLSYLLTLYYRSEYYGDYNSDMDDEMAAAYEMFLKESGQSTHW